MAHLKPTFLWLIQHPICFLGFGFGSGLAPVAPGTFGTIAALPLAWLLTASGITGYSLALLCIPLFFIGIYICGEAEKQLGIQDFGGIVWDEIVAMMLILAFIPKTWAWWLIAFILFRFFDAIKPFPIKWFDARIHGGFGIMLDDIIAACFVIAILLIVQNY